MAAATVMSKDEQHVEPRESARGISPRTTLPERLQNGEMKNSTIVSSPLRSEQRSIVNNKELPPAPTGPLRVNINSANSKHEPEPTFLFAPPAPSSFPFNASPGSTGPSPTTTDLPANGERDRSGNESTSGGIAKRRGLATPTERRSVQFDRGTKDDTGPTPLAKSTTLEANEDTDQAEVLRDRQGSASFFMKLKSLTSSSSSFAGHGRTGSSATGMSTPNAALSPQSERSEPLYPIAAEAVESGTDGDHEDSEAEHVDGMRSRKRRRSKRPGAYGGESLPTTPRASRFTSFMREHTTGSGSRPPTLRRPTYSDAEDNARAGVSEDEGRDKLRTAWKRGLDHARGLSYANRNEGDAPEGKRPSALRRVTGFGGDNSGSPFRHGAERQQSSSAQKWRQVKAGLRLLGQRKKDERMRVDHQKSAQLMAELLAGAPAALILASMFQRDENEHQKVPVLLEQLKITIPTVRAKTDDGERDYIYKVDLEYGNGSARMKWSIERSVKDFFNLHYKYKAQSAADKARHLRHDDRSKAKQPRFPRSVIPYARGMRGLFDKLHDEDEQETSAETPQTPGIIAEETAANTNANARPLGHRRGQSSFFGPPRRQSTSDIGNTALNPDELTARQREIYAQRSRQKLETYLQQMIRWLIFRPDSTRLCKFLEVSAIAIRLSAENGFQGKQGLLQIASRQHLEVRRKLQQFGRRNIINDFKDRHKRRWFLVRHSYIVCTDGPESLIPYDVFLVDSDFAIEKPKQRVLDQKSTHEKVKIAKENAKPTKKAHLIKLYNAERKMNLYARDEHQYYQWRESLLEMQAGTIWKEKQRFGSFAPVRNNVWSRWLVDGRDHMWQVSRAIDNARDVIYIHDWWLSPELYMRRPPAISQKWRLDRLLQRKAEEGVKIFVIVYRNVENAIPINSDWTKESLLDLHANICVQRSPNQFRQNQFFWAHHEKLVVVDNMMAFVGGVDLCFGRWDDPCHSLTDDKLTGFELDHNVPRDSDHCQVWPGKDYSNARVLDFYKLDQPYEEMYDRSRVPRMPWHDIAMQIVGQPARDVGRHFVQRWNYIQRSRVLTRPTPVLVPPPEYEYEELERLGMTGTCQIQILRSATAWSIGTPGKTEHSIMNAYAHLIRTSEHFVYVENQFFISSCEVDGTRINNVIGDAIVERAIRAHDNGEKWQFCAVIPLMPGFQNTVDAQDGSSVRLIMQCQFRSICRGETSIFGRLRERGIEPEDYVRFYSLRQWGKIGPRKCLTTEQLYIHAKCMVVDDRHVIIGSANINERSMLGSRDSEVAAIVTDTRMLPSFMGGKPYEVGEFAHTLRKRLMREHLGVDVDAIYRREQAQAEREREEQDAEMERIYSDHFAPSREYFETPAQTQLASATNTDNLAALRSSHTKADDHLTDTATGDSSSEHNVQQEHHSKAHERDLDVQGYGQDNMVKLTEAGDTEFRNTVIDGHGNEVFIKRDEPDTTRIKNREDEDLSQQRSRSRERKAAMPYQPPWPAERTETYMLGLPTRSQLPELPPGDDTDIGGPPLKRGMSESSRKAVDPLLRSLRRPEVHEDCMADPLAFGFYRDIWHLVAENNTRLYRQVFRCQPDSEVLDWSAYRRFNEYTEAFMQAQGLGKSEPRKDEDAPSSSGPPGAGGTAPASPTGSTFPESVKPPKNILLGLTGKLRPGTKSSKSDTTHAEELREKEQGQRGSPGSAGSVVSSDPTAVPSSDRTPLEEKEPLKAGTPPTDPTDDNGTSTPDDEKAAARREAQANDERPEPKDGATLKKARTVQYSEGVKHASETTATQSLPNGSSLDHTASQKRRRRGTTKSSGRPFPDEVLDRAEAEELLKLVQGHLVLWPYDWLQKEEKGSNWLYSTDTIAPLEIYD